MIQPLFSQLFFSTLVGIALTGSFPAAETLVEQVKCAGKITRIDGERIVIMNAANQEQTMWVVPATQVTLNGKVAAATDLKVGHRITCTCDQVGSKMTCRTITASTRGPERY